MKPVTELFSVEIDDEDYRSNGYRVEDEAQAAKKGTRDPRPFSTTPVKLRLYTQAYIEIEGERYVAEKKDIPGTIYLKVDTIYSIDEAVQILSQQTKDIKKALQARIEESKATRMPIGEHIIPRETRDLDGQIIYFKTLSADTMLRVKYNSRASLVRAKSLPKTIFAVIKPEDRVYNSKAEKIWPIKQPKR